MHALTLMRESRCVVSACRNSFDRRVRGPAVGRLKSGLFRSSRSRRADLLRGHRCSSIVTGIRLNEELILRSAVHS